MNPPFQTFFICTQFSSFFEHEFWSSRHQYAMEATAAPWDEEGINTCVHEIGRKLHKNEPQLRSKGFLIQSCYLFGSRKNTDEKYDCDSCYPGVFRLVRPPGSFQYSTSVVIWTFLIVIDLHSFIFLNMLVFSFHGSLTCDLLLFPLDV